MSNVIEISSKEQFDTEIKSSEVVVVKFSSSSSADLEFEKWSTIFEEATFLAVSTTDSSSLAQEYNVKVDPTFYVFNAGKVQTSVEGTEPNQLQRLVATLAVTTKLAKGEENKPSGSDESPRENWRGAELPRGYFDINSEIEVRGCELLNADEDAGPVKILFDASKPTSVGNKKSATKDYVQSGADDQLLLFVPFQATIKLHTLQITSLPSDDQEDVSRPGVVHLFINKPQNMDFSEADDSEPTQVITLSDDDWNANGTATIPLRFVKFQKTNTLIIYVQQGDGEADAVRIDRIKLVGEAGAKREMGSLQKAGDED